MNVDEKCPKCGGECWRESVDVGVGVIYGPLGCPDCGWSEYAEYDNSEETQYTEAGYYADQWGCVHPMIRKNE